MMGSHFSCTIVRITDSVLRDGEFPPVLFRESVFKVSKSFFGVFIRSCPWDGVRFLEDDLAGTVGVYRHGNQPGGGGTGMLFYCLLWNDGGHVVVVLCFYIWCIVCVCDGLQPAATLWRGFTARGKAQNCSNIENMLNLWATNPVFHKAYVENLYSIMGKIKPPWPFYLMNIIQ